MQSISPARHMSKWNEDWKLWNVMKACDIHCRYYDDVSEKPRGNYVELPVNKATWVLK